MAIFEEKKKLHYSEEGEIDNSIQRLGPTTYQSLTQQNQVFISCRRIARDPV